MKVQFWQVDWGRVLLSDLLIIILVAILNTVVLLLASYVWSPPPRTEMIYQVTSWSTSILVSLLPASGAV